MNVKRFVGKNAREAIAQARALWGDQAVVLSNRPIPGGVEILAMAGAEAPVHSLRAAATANAAQQAAAPAEPMSTVSFQQFVRERQRRDSEAGQAEAAPQHKPLAAAAQAPVSRKPPMEPGRFAAQALREELAQAGAPSDAHAATDEAAFHASPTPTFGASAFTAVAQAGQGEELIEEIKSMRGMLSTQLANMAWFDSVRRDPSQTHALRLMLGNGFSPALARQLVHKLPAGRDEAQAGRWLVDVLANNLRCATGGAETDAGVGAIGERGGVFALVGPTGVGKTTTTAKIAANFALRHGAASVGLITVDTYRMGASDQLRAFGRILNIPVHTARDGASLTDLLDLFDKKLVLIDTVGVGQRDRRLAELFAALPAQRVTRLLVLNAAAQGETLEEVVQAYAGGPGARCVLTKLDEAVKCGAAIDVAIRHQLVVEGFANGQRVPEDWHAARAQLLVQKALLKPLPSAFTHDDSELGLILTTPAAAAPRAHRAHHAAPSTQAGAQGA